MLSKIKFTSEDYQKIGLKQSLIDEIIIIAKKHNVAKIVLFGSRARGDFREKSDIDLAIYGCKNFVDLSVELNEDLWSLLELDIISMDEKYVSKELIAEIERDGVILYEKV